MLLRTTNLVLLAAATVSAQLEPGDFAVLDDGADAVFRMTSSGTTSVIHMGPPITTPVGVAIDGALTVYVADFSSGSIFRIPRGGSIQPLASGIPGPFRIAVDEDGSILAASLTGAALVRVTPSGQVSNVFQGPPFVRPYDVAVDLDGSYLVADEGQFFNARPSALYRVAPGGQITTLWSGPPFELLHGVVVLADGDYAVIDGRVDAMFRVPRGGGPPTVLVQVPAIDNPESTCADFEGRVVLAQELASNRRIDLVDRLGNLTTISNPAPFANLEGIARAPRLAGPRTGRPGQTLTFDIGFGMAEGTRPYVAWASATVVPGILLPGLDTRATPCNPDSVMLTTIGANDLVFMGFAGALSPTGSAALRIRLPNLPLPSLDMHLQAVTVDFRARNSIRSLSNVHRLQL